VLRLVSRGLNLTQAAAELRIARSTASRWANSAVEKLSAENLTHAVAIAIRKGLIDGE
jgi:DNA-binding NarL/FixJ family response regulator